MGAARTLGRPDLPAARWLAPLLVLAAWQAAAQAGWLPERILPAPSSVAAAGAALARSGALWEQAGVSGLRALTGVLLGGGAGVVLGALAGVARRTGAQADSLLQALGLVPVLAFAPLILLWVGVGEAARLALLSLSAFFPVYLHTVRGIRGVDAGLLETGREHGLQGWPLWLHVLLPGALPTILAGLRQGLVLVWLVLVALERFPAPSGLGQLAAQAHETARTDLAVLAIVLYALLSAASFAAVHALRRYLLRWSPAQRPELFSGIH
ncbi:ABC transporter permease subunit [Achromobacter spanius]|uniref:ABC transporter permease subunit n=1 Tax=Achromobacter spanius TaxID=217203 RepID=UPI00320AEA09